MIQMDMDILNIIICKKDIKINLITSDKLDKFYTGCDNTDKL